MKSLLLTLLLAPALPLFAEASFLRAFDDAEKGVVTVTLDEKPLTELHYKEYAKPVLSLFTGPTGANLLRQWPMKDAAPGEAKDHPHHKGVWFTHGSVNGVDFWAETEKTGKITVTGTPVLSHGEDDKGNHSQIIKTKETWKGPDGKTVCTSATTITLGVDIKGANSAGWDRWIDYSVTINASEGDVVFGDTKEGTMGLRSHPALNLEGQGATAHAVNSEGATDKAIWGKKARWVDYSGTVDGKPVGIACFDYPSNLRHPTTWHAREYGLIAANPFGLHDFDKKKNPEGTGSHTVKKGESLTFRYLWLFHSGDTKEAKIEDRWKRWTAGQSRQ